MAKPRVVRNLVSFGALANWLIIALAARLCAGLPWSLALLFGALVTVTGPTVVTPLLRSVRPQREVANILRWEGILIDPIGALLAVLVFEFTVSEQHQHTVTMFGVTVIAGTLLGLAGAWLLATLLRRQWLPDYLHRVASLALVLGVFTLSNTLAAESGLLAVTVMGVRLADLRNLVMEDILDFKETLTLLLISVLFIVLAARIDLGAFAGMGWGAVGVLLAILFVARPAAVWLATVGSKPGLAAEGGAGLDRPAWYCGGGSVCPVRPAVGTAGLCRGPDLGDADLPGHRGHRHPAKPHRQNRGAPTGRGRAAAAQKS